jgi:hypothetical protein
MPTMANIERSIKYLLILLAVVLLPELSSAVTVFNNGSVTITAVVGTITPPPSGGGGGGGGSTGGESMQTSVNFSGSAYPLSKVYILKDGQVAATTIADQAAKFSVTLADLTMHTYSFSVYGEDSMGRKSSSFSFPLYITLGTSVNIGSIYISPTLDIDKTEVKRGENLAIFGQSAPGSEVTISIHSDVELFKKVMSNTAGIYLYNLDTSVLDLGAHQTKSKSALKEQLSSYSTPLAFIVGNEDKKKDSCGTLRGDLNCDNKTNLVDFSIMAYWYKKPNPPSKVDLNSDKKITLIDFSILAYNWTG